MVFARGVTLYILVAGLCSIGGKSSSHWGRVSRSEYCTTVAKSVRAINNRYANAWHTFEVALKRTSVVKGKCDEDVKKVSDDEITDVADSGKKRVVDEYYNAIMYVGTEIRNYERDLHKLTVYLKDRCGFWLSFMPVTNSFKRSIEETTAEATGKVSKIETLSGDAASYAADAANDECSTVEDNRREKEAGAGEDTSGKQNEETSDGPVPASPESPRSMDEQREENRSTDTAEGDTDSSQEGLGEKTADEEPAVVAEPAVGKEAQAEVD
ncbi:T. brucei spp.-specific protein [Trypanosoma brucei gambiense DAL972]|uniref:T. brucei spp.-specific protein n=1 Tax=Trypanosoma brucei gambiense (strain MHOM/CI/86/DAL972) TaxID=679716 RepID=C9ZU00_TRYB9|nr:T. brucei spp.-specific protein [Trypanosoma brucei gambiense DAL972]CBH12886.1 T. brucei spp.-specific protein [Trypanosoma brucei gambiense DAL972]|eukprot:XP_011775165.1 T. brucei spp.-specific protein [Trypanosoma brucei gambiense DAL972]